MSARNDLMSGLMLAGLGALVFARATTFPALAGMAYGPGLFPSIAAVGLMICGALLTITGVRKRSVRVTRKPLDRRASGRIALLLLTVLGYGLLLEPLGFHPASILAVTSAACIFGLPLLRALLLAVLLTVLVHAVFYSLMHVPLPWGVLTPIAW
ncbi:tripartite tricarboxylate transporter TctB family protein [Larsenimonas rhizosphaerae]|uniref:Tripartite tricarboxylate transporter TctB family protein n=1 Tax=Larsenimonas rhizosphaerae TaxID=2944682 RepID=A0AA41ZHG2_9GAMM|nr:tripartite tricarboxylate transporter TctB family protein [Larsenimonas rhizosphaerae]MCX2525309.1 tripartite tricarboxylate transporter TctB family protein [Larsenimonas rhizosphaerae]